MKRYAIGIAVALALLGQEGGAFAQTDPASANRVMPGCRDFVSDADRSMYLQGLCAGLIRAMFYFGSGRFGICPPSGASVGQAARVVVLYIDQRPARMHEVFEDLALEAMQHAWPCKR
jgi:hypothetical protein